MIYKSGILEENYKLSSSLFDIGLDSITIKNIIGNSKLQVYKNREYLDKDFRNNPISNYIQIGSLSEAQRNYFEKQFIRHLSKQFQFINVFQKSKFQSYYQKN